MRKFRQVNESSTRPVETFDVVTETGERIEVETNGNGGFGPVNVWTGDEWLAVKYRSRKN